MFIKKSKSDFKIKKLDKCYFSRSHNLKGCVKVPGDKSISQRALIISLISTGKTIIEDILDSEDVYYTMKAVTQLGAVLRLKKNSIEVKGVGLGNLVTPKKPIFMGNSGTGIRLLLGLVAGSNTMVTFYGDSSLTERPMDRIISPLEEMGATILCNDDKKLPITIAGARVKGFTLPINYKLTIPSAQIKSSVLLAALTARGTSFITEYNKSRNYTEKMLSERGVILKNKKINKDKNILSIQGASLVRSKGIKVPGDPSSAAFLAVAALITKKSSITIENVLYDKFRLHIFNILKKMGAFINIIRVFDNRCKIIVKSSKLKNITIESKSSSALIDEYPILAIAASVGEGEMIMKGLGELRYKESDRFKAIVEGLNKCGGDVKSFKDNIHIKGKKSIKGGCALDVHYDHRIAMSFNILSLISEKPILIKGNQSILTSFPDFFKTLDRLGAVSLFHGK
jgi:3-phosphoshikimate 1-carboxyvinyltransferase